MRPELESSPVLAALTRWSEAGWLRPLDLAFARFLHEQAPRSNGYSLLAGALASYQLGQGHTFLDLANLPDPAWLAEREATRPDGRDADLVVDELCRLLADRGMADWTTALGAPEQPVARPEQAAAPHQGGAPLVLDGERLYLRRYWNYERQVRNDIAQRLSRSVPVPADLRQRLESLFSGRTVTSPDWQRIACALAARRAFCLITGGPGTGKTTTVVRLLALLQSAALEGRLVDADGQAQAPRALRIRLAAPTGKAAARLTESIGGQVASLAPTVRARIPTRVQTLHQLLGVRPGTSRPLHHAGNPLHVDLLVVDEASMIDLEMMATLLTALAPSTRLVLLGDRDQLASVEAGSVLGDLAREAGGAHYSAETVDWIGQATGEDLRDWQGPGSALANQTVMLQHSHRFGADSGIGQLARAVNAGDLPGVESLLAGSPSYPDLRHVALDGPADDRLVALCIDGSIRAPLEAAKQAPAGHAAYLNTLAQARPSDGEDREAVDAWARAVIGQFDRFQLLAAVRQGPWGVEGLNRRIESVLYQRGLIPATEGWYEGRPVLVTRNDYALGLMNGDIGITLAMPEAGGAARLRVVFPLPDGGLRYVLPGRLAAVETVYALTVHKSQGSEFEHAALVLPQVDTPVISRALLYTAITRARRTFTLLTGPQVDLDRAIAAARQ
ncbi:MAG: exodeoxyribonuclease V subunit alpha [Halothiobacillaceae bacterium]